MAALGRPQLSVVVATRDRPVLLEGCLASLRAALGPADELIVVDSASREAAAMRQVIAAHGARYVRCDEPGASRARNTGWRAASNDIVAFIDDDARVLPGWADAARAALADANEVSFITGRIGHPDPVERAERPVAIFDHTTTFPIVNETVEPFGHGANHAVRRSALDHVGGFDERLGAGGEFPAAEDLDLWDRLVLAGYVGRYVPEMAGWHEQWRDRRDNLGLDWAYGYGGGVRLAKLLRSDRGRAARSARVIFGSWGVVLTIAQLRQRHRYLAMLNVIRMCGAVAGVARGILVPIRGGHLAPRRGRPAR